VAALIGEGGLTDLRRLRLEMVDLRQEIERREATIRELEQEVRALEGDTLALERIAREQLGLVRPGEIDFLLPVQEGDPWAQAMPRRRLAGHP
jgi:cell division protein FtsB